MVHWTQIVGRPAIVMVVLGTGACVFAWPPIPQPIAYHDLADQRTWLGVPNALNVLSNVAFVIVGVVGLWVLWGPGASPVRFRDPWERWPYAVLFAGVALTGLGSGWYHLAPDNARLVWDRLPMALGFMGLLTAVIAERIGLGTARVVFGPLLLAGVASVIYWHWTEVQGQGDLRPYILVQFGSLLTVVALLLFYRSPYRDTRYVTAGLLTYGAAKVFEFADTWVFSFGQIVSGHTLKHVTAAGAVACLVVMLHTRRRSP